MDELQMTKIDEQEVLKFYRLLRHDSQTELRAIIPKVRTNSFHFSTEEELLNLCRKYNGHYNLYLGINERLHNGTKKEEVSSVGLIPVDVDCVTKPASQSDLEEAKKIVQKISSDFIQDGYKRPTIIFSGNGFQLFFSIPKIQITNDNRDKVQKQIEDFGKRLIEKYSTDKVRLDNIYDLPRIMRVPGTYNLKSKTSAQIVDMNYELDGLLQKVILETAILDETFNYSQAHQSDEKFAELYGGSIDDLNVGDIFGLGGLKKRGGGEYQGEHPVHGSTSGMNFTINPGKNMWHCFRCHPSKTKIITTAGICNIEEIKKGDFVFGENGQKNEVINCFNFNKSEKIYKLKTYAPDLELTEDHPVYVATIRYSGKHLAKKNPSFSWKIPGSINPKKDFLVVPKKHHILTYKNLSRQHGELIGWYLADGHLIKRKKAVQITIGQRRKVETARRICNLSKKLFGGHAKFYSYPNRGVFLIQIHSTKLYDFLNKEIGTGSANKKLGNLVNAPMTFLSELIETYIKADGHITKFQSQRISSVSERLIREIQHILFKEGIPARYYFSSESNNSKAKHPRHSLQWQLNQKHKSEFQDENYLYLPIKEVTSRNSNERVYSIQTTDGTYLLPFIVHNCNSGGTALSAIAVKEGLINCSDARSGAIRSDLARQALKIAEEKYGLKNFSKFKGGMGYEKIDSEPDKIEPTSPAVAGKSLNIWGIKDFKELKKETDYVVEDFIYPKTVTMFYSPPGEFKSLLCLDMAISIATGRDWMELATISPDRKKEGSKPRAVLYCDKENNDQILKARIEGLLKGEGLENYDKEIPIHFLRRQGNFYDGKFLAELRAFIREHKIEVIFLDTMHRFADYDENKADDINRVYTWIFTPLIEEFGVSIVFLHHSKKDGGYRGSGDFLGMVDTSYQVFREKKGEGKSNKFRIINEKSRAGEIEVVYGEIDFGINSDGDLGYIKILRTDAIKEKEKEISEAKKRLSLMRQMMKSGETYKYQDYYDYLELQNYKSSRSSILRTLAYMVEQRYINKDEKGNYFLSEMGGK